MNNTISNLKTLISIKGYGVVLNDIIHPSSMEHITVIRTISRNSDIKFIVSNIEARSHPANDSNKSVTSNLGRLLVPYKIYGIKYLTVS